MHRDKRCHICGEPLVGTGQAERARIARDLELYCERDTYAMYAIWRHLLKDTMSRLDNTIPLPDVRNRQKSPHV